ncbi:MAG: LPS export ABC transporter periplasmic protein LptC [gamma proteobacterium symbiont of Bathyaustriella thionipta]|nr:LPS export ABC transporter periplasmic protein LptC [gamma proteobacterium symbiont of Bathyaustriella thionipta]MCU7948433.1 LPS export ABC transporter periplasmic protein LptC [gamma proteobacterium symbiont of Bathyaustriella thionipta]MCU7954132.1 LPS export ABC transporter periplasmic protein LptC [gamma proteobacterium symbiont of Bathyaustriella thionipta]MCU7955983.1 LPS export ABC transporter periplasmic protein LptC [gamma proteobacterium symbiont of Bathyaustriella thionipta]MCU79
MDKKLLTILLAIPAASIAITWYVFTLSASKQTSINLPAKNSALKIADTFFNTAEIINFGETGLPKSKIIGAQVSHYPDEADSEIMTPRITLFRENGPPVYVSADHGWINKQGTRVILKGHTVIKREQSQVNQFSQLESPELTIWPNRDYAETDKAVKITTDSTIATGVGMKAFLDKEHYYLLNNVKAQHIPAKPKPD